MQPPITRFTLPDVRWKSDAAESAKLARLSTDAPRIPWNVFVKSHLKWLPGEHVALVGGTGSGKTTLMLNLLPLHPYVTVFATKPKDETMDLLIHRNGYLRMQEWKSLDPKQFPRRVLWPDSRKLNSKAIQRDAFSDAFDRIYLEGGWTVAVDELWWLENMLGLGDYIKSYELQARSLKISLLVNTQRPAWVSREVYSQSTHLFFFRTNDENDLRTLGGLSYLSADLVRFVVSNLDWDAHQALYINTRTGRMCRTRCPEIQGV